MRILIIRPDKIGDVILTLPMATAIKSSMPDAHVAFLVREYTASLLSLAPDIDETIVYDRNSTMKETVALIRKANPDAIFVFGHKFKLTLASFLAGVPIRVGRAYWFYSLLYNKKIFEHRKKGERSEAEYNTRMLEAIGIRNSPTPLPNLDILSLPKNPIVFSRYIVFHIPTGGSAPQWGDDHFIELGKALSQRFRVPIILTGLPSDSEYLFRVAERMKQYESDVHIHTESNLLELASLLASAMLVISGSTGPGHLAAALGTPTIGIFPGVISLSKTRWGFRGKQVVNLSPLVRPKAECPDCNDCICINEIGAGEVLQALDQIIK